MADQSGSELTMQDKEYRQFYRDARNRELLAMQIRAMREKRGWTQEQLGVHAGGMRQERISVLEDADNGSITYKTLSRLADAFDVDLIVRFAPYSETEQWVREMGPDQLAVPSFDEDCESDPGSAVGRHKISSERPHTNVTNLSPYRQRVQRSPRSGGSSNGQGKLLVYPDNGGHGSAVMGGSTRMAVQANSAGKSVRGG